MARLMRIAVEGAMEGIVKSPQGLSAWELGHGEVGCTKGRLRRKMQILCAVFGLAKRVGAESCSLVLHKLGEHFKYEDE
jgi:hypothetical protein